MAKNNKVILLPIVIFQLVMDARYRGARDGGRVENNCIAFYPVIKAASFNEPLIMN